MNVYKSKYNTDHFYVLIGNLVFDYSTFFSLGRFRGIYIYTVTKFIFKDEILIDSSI